MESVPGEVEIREDNRVAAVAACTKGGRKVMEDQHLIFTHFNELIGLQGKSFSKLSFLIKRLFTVVLCSL